MSDRAEALRARLFATFRIEAEEHLRTIRTELDAVAVDHAPERLESLLRTMHTLKGAARSVGLTDFEEACHRCEARLSALIESGSSIDTQVLRELQDASDVLAGVVRLDAPRESVPRSAQSETIRVEIGRLDQLVTLTESLLSPKLVAAEHVLQARGLAEEIERIRARLASTNLSADGNTTSANLELREDLRSLEMRARGFVTILRGAHRSLRTAVDDLYKEMLSARMMPAASVLEAFPLMVRDLCRDTGKEADWEVLGAQLEIDRKVLDLVKDPLIHLVRNAIDHGIELPDAREAAGKSRRGRVRVTVARTEGGRISIEVADDGRGFHIDAIRDAAVRSRLTSVDHLAAMSDAEVADLAFAAGLSTSPVITTISGHGRGLAIVRERIERVGGQIATRSSAGTGTVIRLEFPASIVTYRALLVSAAGARFLLPAESVDRVFSVPPDEAAASLGRGLLAHSGRALPFGSLEAILGLAGAGQKEDGRRMLPCVVVRNGERHGILLVDEVVGEHEIVVKDLRPPLRRVRNVLAAGLLGTGDLVLILRPLDVLLSIHARAPTNGMGSISSPGALRILVVDDSITTRTMERNLFEAVGYVVRVAADGVDAWNIVQTEDVDVIVSDVDMPRMDGFELTSRIRNDPKLVHLPVVLVTALEAREEKERGIRVGANAYVLKSGFNQANLLEIVRRLT